MYTGYQDSITSSNIINQGLQPCESTKGVFILSSFPQTYLTNRTKEERL